MFKKGDRVELLHSYSTVSEGDRGTVVLTTHSEVVDARYGRAYQLLDVKMDNDDEIGVFDFRCKKVEEVVIKTDKELADEYRWLRAEALAICDTLIGKGFELYNGKSRTVRNPGQPDFKFKKTVTETIEV